MEPTVEYIDFAATPLRDAYSGYYAVIIDNAFSSEECDHLKQLPLTNGDDWKIATRNGQQSSFRNNERILRMDELTAGAIFDRLKPLVEEDIGIIEPRGTWNCITGNEKRKGGVTWKLKGVNPRLSFLRYEPGQFFKHHCDASVEVNQEKAFVTLHLYLNDATTSEPLEEVGATRFWTPDKKHYLDVEPKLGRVLIFQQRLLWHTGEAVKRGVKYTMRSDFMYERV
ncbi:hypothetical protein DL96DRAFT_1474463 [Flagelloscypha sp. PMI_526]|nr:hypothetical protein DL96DRAFT_1474463 [Flagelloscypha sp. PMI_526]